MVLSLSIAVHAADDKDDEPVAVSKKTLKSGFTPTLPRLLELAEEHSPQILSAKKDLEIAELNLKSSRAAFLPTLDFTSHHGLLRNDPLSTKNPWNSDLNLQLNENFYDNGVALNNYDLNQKTVKRLRLQYELTRDQQLSGVAQAFFDWSNSTDQREIDENKKDLLDRQYNLLEIQYRQGIKSRRDVLRIETEVTKQKIAILSRDNEVALNLQKLATQVGVTVEDFDDESLTAEEAKPLALNKQFKALRFEEHKQAKVYALLSEEKRINARLVERNYWPQLSLVGNGTYDNPQYVNSGRDFDDTRSLTWSVLLQVNYNLWDWGTRRREMQVARIQVTQVEDGNRARLLSLGDQLKDVNLKLVEYRENFKSSRELLTLEQQAYNILEEEYRNGRTSYLDLITGLGSLIDARSRYILTYFNLRKEQALYAFHSGEFYEKFR